MADMDGSSSLIYAILAMSHLHIEASNSYSRLELSNWVAMVPSLIDGMASPTRYHTSTTIVHMASSFSTVLTNHAVTRWQPSLQMGVYDPSNNNWAYGHRGRIAQGRPTTHQINGFRMRASIWAEASSRFVAIWAESHVWFVLRVFYTNFESWGKVA